MNTNIFHATVFLLLYNNTFFTLEMCKHLYMYVVFFSTLFCLFCDIYQIQKNLYILLERCNTNSIQKNVDT